MAVPFPERWRDLKRLLDADQPATAAQYVRPPRGCAEDVWQEIASDPGATPKILLVGARGGGKSSELREIGRQLRATHQVIGVDLDRSGVGAASVTAIDLLYLSGVALLRGVRSADADRADQLFGELATAYAGGEREVDSLGSLAEALEGLSTFAAGAGAAADALGLATGVAPGLGSLMGAVGRGIRLFADRPGVTAETSPAGHRMLLAVDAVARAARAVDGGRPLCVLVDGLEKMNGQSGDRFRQIFEETRLLSDAPWASVYAAPPSTLTETHAAESVGWRTSVVWGFGPDGVSDLRALLLRRFDAADMPLPGHCAPALLDRMAEQSGGLPREVMRLAHRAAELARRAGGERVEPGHVDAALEHRGEELAQGLHEGHWRVLRRVAALGMLPREDLSASLFADGRVIACAPARGQRAPTFFVHPLLRGEVERLGPLLGDEER